MLSVRSSPVATALAIGSAIKLGLSGSFLYVDANGNLAQDNSNLFWDSVNKRFLVGTNSGLSAKIGALIGAVAEKGLVLKAPLSYTGNYVELQDNAGVALLLITSLGVIRAADGTEAVPGFSFALDINDGFWRRSDDTLALTLNGITRVEWSTISQNMGSAIQLAWSSSANPTQTGNDIGLVRDAAGVLRVTDGSSAYGDLLTKRFKPKGGTAIATTDWALGAGWGANAMVSAVSGNDQRGTVTVTTSALDTPGANPTLTLTFKDGTWTTAPFAVANLGTTGTGLTGAVEVNTTATTLVLEYVGTPTALVSNTYVFHYHVIG